MLDTSERVPDAATTRPQAEIYQSVKSTSARSRRSSRSCSPRRGLFKSGRYPRSLQSLEMETRSDTSPTRARSGETRTRARARARDITGNEIKKIANNSNPNCHGHIPRQTAIRSRGGEYDGKTKRERRGDRKKGEREKEKEKIVMKEKERKKEERERESERAKPLYNF